MRLGILADIHEEVEQPILLPSGKAPPVPHAALPAPELLPYPSTCVLRRPLERAFQGRERQAGTPALPGKEPDGSARVVFRAARRCGR